MISVPCFWHTSWPVLFILQTSISPCFLHTVTSGPPLCFHQQIVRLELGDTAATRWSKCFYQDHTMTPPGVAASGKLPASMISQLSLTEPELSAYYCVSQCRDIRLRPGVSASARFIACPTQCMCRPVKLKSIRKVSRCNPSRPGVIYV